MGYRVSTSSAAAQELEQLGAALGDSRGLALTGAERATLAAANAAAVARLPADWGQG
jgi:hypothetical protein